MEGMDTREINIVDLFYYVMSKWRMLIVGALVGAILLGAFGASRAIKNKPSEEELKTAQQEYEDAMKAYETNKEKLQMRIDNLENNLEQQQYIQERSIMLEMDPYNIYEAIISYYVDTNYEIVPELYYQDPNYTAVITNSYNAAIQRLDLDQLFATEARPEVMTANPVSGNGEQLLSVSVDAGNGTLTITARADSQENLDRLTDAIQETIEDTKTVLYRTIGEHTLSVLDSTTSQTVDFDYASMQQSFNDNIYDLMQSLANSNDELTELEEPTAPSETPSNVKAEAIKYAVIGLFVGIFVVAFLFAFAVILKNRMISVDEIKEGYQIPVLGTLAGKKKQSRLDAFFAGKLGLEARDEEDSIAYIKSSKELYLKENQVLLVSASAADELNDLAQKLKDADTATEYRIAGDLMRTASAVDSLHGATSVICVEKWMKFTHEDLKKEIAMIRQVLPQDKIAVIITR